ncbi:uncharacterized protein LOC116250030 [Nymphaea colorata]|nr:uncharacterized protein LOC116250030 [Nymphaea colorata]
MGSCCSRDAAVLSAASSSSSSSCRGTAKLVLPDGDLQEFAWPVKASHVLRREPACFICNSDAMEYDGSVSAIGAEEELQPGQLYFVLPLSSLRRPLSPAEMAALAARASAALSRKGYDVFVADEEEEQGGLSATKGRAGGCGRRAGARLGTIQEGWD